VIITLGIFSLMGKEINLTIVAALLTIVGYSINDTVIVFDRVREKMKTEADSSMSLKTVLNISLNETLSRTVLTSGTTLLAVLALFIFGGEVIHGFALALLVGIGFGTYSSICVAAALVYVIMNKKEAKAIA
jgi:preprotein translocase subunit SecF